MKITPFALVLHARYQSGVSPEKLAKETNIPLERVKIRLRAAEKYLNDEKPRAQAPQQVAYY